MVITDSAHITLVTDPILGPLTVWQNNQLEFLHRVAAWPDGVLQVSKPMDGYPMIGLILPFLDEDRTMVFETKRGEVILHAVRPIIIRAPLYDVHALSAEEILKGSELIIYGHLEGMLSDGWGID